jgi:hypothetical protein
VTTNAPGVFLSASIPSGERAAQFLPSDSARITGVVTTMARAILRENWRLVFGGHPTITPLILLIAGQEDRHGQVEVFQSEWFAEQITDETRQLERLGLGRIVWTRRRDTLPESLDEMRRQALSASGLIGAGFIGGMEGIVEEFQLAGSLFPGRTRFRIGGPGGAARYLS